MNAEKIIEDAIFRVGRVIAVEGRTVKIQVDKTKNTSHLVYKGELLKNISVGGYVKIVKGFTLIIGKVDGEVVTEDRVFLNKEYGSGRQRISRILNVSLLGFFNNKKFERGIKELPLVDNECYLLQGNEFNQVHNFVSKNDKPLSIGTLSLEKGQVIKVGINALFASHIGIFGNTGSGKSYTLAKIYRELFNQYKAEEKFKDNTKFIFLDFNGEYVSEDDDVIIEKAYKDVYKLSTKGGGDKFPLEKDSLLDPDFWIIFLQATDKTQAPFIRRALLSTYIDKKISSDSELKDFLASVLIDATAAGNDRALGKAFLRDFLNELQDCFDKNSGIQPLLADFSANLQIYNKNNTFFYAATSGWIYSGTPEFDNKMREKVSHLNLGIESMDWISRIRLKITLQYYLDIKGGFSNRDHLAPLIKRMDKRIDDLERVIVMGPSVLSGKSKNIIIVSLKDVNIEMRKILPLLLSKQIYGQKKRDNNQNKYLNLIIDEAHNILSEESERESEQWKDYRLEAFEEMIKEGRKFGAFLTIASQRPSDISPTIISQLHNYFIHRLVNHEDISAVKNTISYLDKVSTEYLSILPTGTCIIAGLLANIPVVVDIGGISEKFEPKNKTIILTDKWS